MLLHVFARFIILQFISFILWPKFCFIFFLYSWFEYVIDLEACCIGMLSSSFSVMLCIIFSWSISSVFFLYSALDLSCIWLINGWWLVGNAKGMQTIRNLWTTRSELNKPNPFKKNLIIIMYCPWGRTDTCLWCDLYIRPKGVIFKSWFQIKSTWEDISQKKKAFYSVDHRDTAVSKLCVWHASQLQPRTLWQTLAGLALLPLWHSDGHSSAASAHCERQLGGQSRPQNIFTETPPV